MESGGQKGCLAMRSCGSASKTKSETFVLARSRTHQAISGFVRFPQFAYGRPGYTLSLMRNHPSRISAATLEVSVGRKVAVCSDQGQDRQEDGDEDIGDLRLAVWQY